jgi:hypothetical protein
MSSRLQFQWLTKHYTETKGQVTGTPPKTGLKSVALMIKQFLFHQ